MNRHDFRYKNAQILVEEAGGVTAFGKRIGKSQSQTRVIDDLEGKTLRTTFNYLIFKSISPSLLKITRNNQWALDLDSC